jgi:hypothetical protein
MEREREKKVKLEVLVFLVLLQTNTKITPMHGSFVLV